MSKEHYFNLQHSESVVARMAATIFAAYIQSNQVNDATEDHYLKKAAETAARLASYTDQIIKSDEEWMPQTGKSIGTL
jgi:hypothetical protein